MRCSRTRSIAETAERGDTFSVGYSPERINPGDKAHRVTNILKVTSGSTPAAADFVDALLADSQDAALENQHNDADPRLLFGNIVMTSRDHRIALARDCLSHLDRLRP